MSRRFWVLILACLLPAGLVGGCAAKGDGAFAVPAGEYDGAFEATRQVLREQRFVLERVDAEAGVITTREKPSAGLATPWDPQQTTLRQESQDLFNQQRRAVRVTFAPAQSEANQERAARVEVTIFRVHQPGMRLSPKSWQLAVVSRDPALTEAGLGPGFAVATERDPYLEARLARAIEARMQTSRPAVQ